MANSRLETLADALDELHESFEAHLREASDLVQAAEAAEFLVGAHKAKLEQISQLVDSTRALRQSVAEKRRLLQELHAQMSALLPPKH